MKNIYKIFLYTQLVLASCFIQAQSPDFSISGFATTNGGTTGGAGGTEVTVSSYADLKKYAEEVDTKYIIKISGTIKGTGSVAAGTYAGSVKVKSNKTILGLGNTSFLDGVGLSISGVKNIIVQNVKFSMISVGKAIPSGSGDIAGIYSALGDEGRPQILVNGGDLISISGSNNNIWIDHCEFYEEDPSVQTNIDLYDGLVDIKNDSRYITISWCYFHDHHKCSLIGSADSDLFAERKVTFHHNYYNKVGSRIPLIRGGIAHVFNNYILGASGCSNSRMDACVLSEKNYFENSKNAVYSSGSSQVGGALVSDNVMINSTTTTLNTCNPAIPYNYTSVLTSDANSVKNLVTTYAGVGKLTGPLGLFEEEISIKNYAYPNPFETSFHVAAEGAFEYTIYDSEGISVELGHTEASQALGTALHTGMYIIRIQQDEQVSWMKVNKK